MDLILPPRLYPGDPVGVVAASGPVDERRFAAGLRVLAERYRPAYDESTLFARAGFLAGTDAHRLRALEESLADPGCRAVFLARGGYGLLRILPRVDLQVLQRNPKPIVGFSDVTALLALCARADLAAIHGPVVSQLGELSDQDLDALFSLLEDPAPRVLLTGLEELVPGRVQGPLLGGNLEVLTRLLGTPFAPAFDGAVLFLEEVGELPYRIDRLLTHLELSGVLSRVAGIVAGKFIDCDIGESETQEVGSPTTLDVLCERLGRLPVPVVLGGTFGHGTRNTPLPYGGRVELDTVAGRLVALHGVVS